MSDKEDTPIVTPADARIAFLQDPKKHPLAKTLKKLDKNLDDAIDLLINYIGNPEMDPKERKDAAKFLIEKKIEISEAINKDTLSRMVLEAKQVQSQMQMRVGTMKPKDVTPEDDDEVPQKARFVSNMILKAETQGI